MQTIALRLYGKNDLRLEAFELPPIQDDEILADVTSNSICMSDYKVCQQGPDHKRVPGDIAQNPVILGHEFCGTILAVGQRCPPRFRAGLKYSIQPALSYPGRELEAPGYSFRFIGGNATKVIIPREVLKMDCLLPYSGQGYFPASLAEPVSCIIGAFQAQYHFPAGSYAHQNGIKPGGCLALLAGAGPMGLAAIDYALYGPVQPRLLAVTDIDESRLQRAAEIYPPAAAQRRGVALEYLNTKTGNPGPALLADRPEGL